MSRPIVYTAVPTAFYGNGALDLSSTRRIFEHALDGGVDALFVNGTTAEFAALTIAERKEVLAAAVEVAGAERVVAHVGAASPYHSGALSIDAVELGITKLSVLTPFYMPATVDGVREQVAASQRSAPDAEIYLYLFPDRTGVQVPASTAAAMIEEFDLAGAKISIAGTEYLAELVRSLSRPRTVLSGNDGLMREVASVGGDGVVSGVSASIPRPFVALAAALGAGDAAAADAIAEEINTIVPVLGPSIASLKYSLVQQGVIETATCRMAIDPPDASMVSAISDVLTAATAVAHPRTA